MQANTLAATDLALRAGLIVLTLFTAALMLRELSRHVAARLGVALAIGVAAYAIQSTAGFAMPPHGWQALILALSAGNAVVFWLFSRAIFDDEFELRPWHGFAWLMLAAAPIVNCFVLRPNDPVAARTLGDWITVTTLGLSMLAVGQSVSTWRDDLIERRRRLRIFIVASGAAYTVIMTFVKLGESHGGPSGMTGAVDMLALMAIVVIIAWQMVRVSDGGMFTQGADVLASEPRPVAVKPEPVDALERRKADEPVTEPASESMVAPVAEKLPDETEADPADAVFITKLEHLMTVERFHQEDGVSIGALADRLNLPEHKLRRLINRRLGYRNFNAFLNHYRLTDAKASLADPAQADVPVLTIAMGAGFQSLGPFNRAFKADTGLTPTEYRRLGWSGPLHRWR